MKKLFAFVLLMVAMILPIGASAGKLSSRQSAYGISYYLDNNGILWQWGKNFNGEYERPKLLMTDVKDFIVDSWYITVLTENGDVWTWGAHIPVLNEEASENGIVFKGIYTYDDPLLYLNNVDSIYHSNIGFTVYYAILDDHSLVGWSASEDNYGYMVPEIPTIIMEDVASFYSCYSASYAIKTDNSLWGWSFHRKTSQGNMIELKKLMDSVADIKGTNNTIAVMKTDGSLWGASVREYVWTGFENLNMYLIIDQVSDYATSLYGSKVMAMLPDGNIAIHDFNDYLEKQTAFLQGPDHVVQIEMMPFSDAKHNVFLLTEDGVLYRANNGKTLLTDEMIHAEVFLENVDCFDGFMAIQNDGAIWQWKYNEDKEVVDLEKFPFTIPASAEEAAPAPYWIRVNNAYIHPAE